MLVVGIGGFLGANARYLLSLLLGEWFGRRYPIATFLINATGSFLLAVFLAWAARHSELHPNVRLLIAVGFFGAYTTFSSFSNETIALFQSGAWAAGLAYVLGTNAVCIVLAAAGLMIGSRL